MKIGSICVKTAGRDSGKVCIVIDEIDGMVLIDGLTRRRKCNVRHLEWLGKNVEIKKGASHEDVLKHLASLGVKVVEKGKKKVRDKKAVKPVRVRKVKKGSSRKIKKGEPERKAKK